MVLINWKQTQFPSLLAYVRLWRFPYYQVVPTWTVCVAEYNRLLWSSYHSEWMGWRGKKSDPVQGCVIMLVEDHFPPVFFRVKFSALVWLWQVLSMCGCVSCPRFKKNTCGCLWCGLSADYIMLIYPNERFQKCYSDSAQCLPRVHDTWACASVIYFIFETH